MMENKKFFFIYLISIYSFLIFGLIIGEDPIKGASLDFKSHIIATKAFSEDFFNTLINYDKIGMRHSPVFYILRSLFINNEFLFKFVFLNLMIVSVYFFYKSLRINFDSSKYLLIYFATLLTILPTYRSYSFWPDPHLLGFVFFMISINYFLKFVKARDFYNQKKYAKFNTIFLVLSAYISPNYGLFVIFNMYNFYIKTKNIKFLSNIFLLNLLLGLPFFLYLFVFDINFIFGNSEFNIGENIYSITNISNKIVLILSLILFYQIPLILNLKKNFFNVIFVNKFLFLVLTIAYLYFCFKFDFSKSYNITNSGGGIIYSISNKIFDNNNFLFFFSFISLIIQFILSSISKSNILLFLCIFLSHPQETLWQANLSPMLFVIIFTLFIFPTLSKNEFINKKLFTYYFTYFLSFYLISNFREFLF